MIANAIIASVAAIFIAVNSFENTVGAFLCALFLSWMFAKFLNFITLSLFKMTIYAGDWDNMMKDADNAIKVINSETVEVPTREIKFKILGTSEPLGKFMDATFYDWIEAEDENGVKHKLNFTGTLDISNGINVALPDGSVLLPPGLLYQVEELVNNPT